MLSLSQDRNTHHESGFSHKDQGRFTKTYNAIRTMRSLYNARGKIQNEIYIVSYNNWKRKGQDSELLSFLVGDMCLSALGATGTFGNTLFESYRGPSDWNFWKCSVWFVIAAILNSDQVESLEEYKRIDLVLNLQPYLSTSSSILSIAQHKHSPPGSLPLEAKKHPNPLSLPIFTALYPRHLRCIFFRSSSLPSWPAMPPPSLFLAA